MTSLFSTSVLLIKALVQILITCDHFRIMLIKFFRDETHMSGIEEICKKGESLVENTQSSFINPFE